MKKIILLLLLVIGGCAGYHYITEAQRHSEFIEDHSLSKEESFTAVNEWIAKNFTSANDVIQMKDINTGTIISQAVGSYWYDALHTLSLQYEFTLSIKTKDNKIKLEFTTHNIVGGNYLPQQGDLHKINDYYADIKNRILDYLKNYKSDDF